MTKLTPTPICAVLVAIDMYKDPQKVPSSDRKAAGAGG